MGKKETRKILDEMVDGNDYDKLERFFRESDREAGEDNFHSIEVQRLLYIVKRIEAISNEKAVNRLTSEFMCYSCSNYLGNKICSVGYNPEKDGRSRDLDSICGMYENGE